LRLKEVDAVMMNGVTDEEARSMMETLCKMRENLVKELDVSDEAS
jgi:hypothetical protein